MGKKDKKRTEEHEDEEQPGSRQVEETKEEQEVDKKKKKKDKKEKRRSQQQEAEEEETKEETPAAEQEEDEEEPPKKKSKKDKKDKKRSEEQEPAEDEDAGETATTSTPSATHDGDFDLSTLKKANSQHHPTLQHHHTSHSPPTLELSLTPLLDPVVPLLSTENGSTSTPLTSSSSSSGPAAEPVAGSRVFLGNLSFKVTDELIVSHFAACGPPDGLHYVTDKTTGKFYGSAFLDFPTPQAAEQAIRLNGSDMLGRPIKVGYATGVNAQGANRNNSKGKGGHLAAAPVSEKPEGTTTVFLGNLSFEVTEDEIRKVFEKCGEVTQVRWVEKDGVFKGCGFVEFDTTEATDAAVKMNGQEVLGRPMRVDYSASNKKTERY